MQQDRVDQQQLKQERDVADGLDVDRGQRRDEPVVRQASDTHRETDDGGEEDADDRYEDCVQEPDDEGPAERVGRTVGDQGLADVEPGCPVEESKTAGDAELGQIGHRVADQDIAAENDQRHHQQLIKNRPDAGIAVERDLRHVSRLQLGSHRSVDPQSGPSGHSFLAANGGQTASLPPARPLSGTADYTSGRRLSKARSDRARSSAACWCRHCARSSRRNCRPA